MKIKICQVDAFTGKLFGGNPAAVCPLDEWLPDALMQKIAMENNLSETAFFTRNGKGYSIRWFTPRTEVALCGHATLASAHIIFTQLQEKQEEIVFESKSGALKVGRKGNLLVLNFPADHALPVQYPEDAVRAIGAEPTACFKGRTDYLFVYKSEQQVIDIQPDFRMLYSARVRGIIVTAPGKQVDFVSRFFAPAVGVDEDPVTGSAHTTLIPYWSERLGKKEMKAMQCSARGGYIECLDADDRVEIGGEAVTYLTGEIQV